MLRSTAIAAIDQNRNRAYNCVQMRDPQVRWPLEDDATVDPQIDVADPRNARPRTASREAAVRTGRRRRRLLNLFPESALEPEPATSPGVPQLVFQPRAGSPQPDPPVLIEPADRTTPTVDDQPPMSSIESPPQIRRVPSEHAKDELLVAIRSCRGPVVLIGPTSNVCREVIQELDRRTVASRVRAPKSFDDLLKMVLVDFGVMTTASADHADVPRPRLAAALHSFLSSLASLHARAVIFIDGAENVPAVVISELPALSAQSDAGILQLVLVGRPEFMHLLERPDLHDFDASVAVRLELDSPNASDSRSETRPASATIESPQIVDAPPIESTATDLESEPPARSTLGSFLIVAAVASAALASARALVWVFSTR